MPDVFVAKKHNKTNPKIKSPKKPKKHGNPKVTYDRLHNLDKKHMLEDHTKNPLAAYCYFPDHVDFIGADSEEKIVLLLRRHAITNLKWIIMSIILIILPVIVMTFSFLDFMPMRFQIVILMFWYLISFAYTFEKFIGWFFNVYIVTDERVFDVDFINLTYREITDANLKDIQDVTVRVGSVVRTLFDYGDVLIQTAAEIPQIEFEAVPQPDKVSQVIRELRVEEEIEEIEGRVR